MHVAVYFLNDNNSDDICMQAIEELSTCSGSFDPSFFDSRQ